MKLSNKGHWDVALPRVASISVFFFFTLTFILSLGPFLLVFSSPGSVCP